MKTIRWLLRIGAVALLLWASAAGYAAKVAGQLLFAGNNSPAPYIAVRLSSPGKGASPFVYSAGDGRFYLYNVPAGNYQLEVWRDGKQVAAVAVSVPAPRSVVEVPPVRLR